MKKRNPLFNLTTSLFLIIAMILTASSVALADDETAGYDSVDDYLNSLLGGTSTEIEVPEITDMNLVGEKGDLTLYYHEDGADIYISNSKTKKVWSSAVEQDYMDTSELMPSESTMLMEIGIANAEGANNIYQLLDTNSTDINVTPNYGDSELTLNIEVVAEEVFFDFKIFLEEDGFSYTIPDDSIKENGKSKLVSIACLPNFGTASKKEDGYIFYPDGSGALINIKKYDIPESTKYTYPIYGTSELDVDAIVNDDQDLKSMTMPVVGMKTTDSGYLAVVEKGYTDAYINISVGKAYQTFFHFDYRKYALVSYNFTGSVFNEMKSSLLMPAMIKGDRTVRYYLLDKNNNTYSDMAKTYRNHLVEDGVLTKQENKDVPMSLDLFMGIGKEGFISKSVVPMTTYAQANDILSDLIKQGVTTLDVSLMGWSKGGYDVLPTPAKAESKLGGQSNLDDLKGFCKDKNIDLYLNADFLKAIKGSSTYNEKKDAVRDMIGTIATDYYEKYHIMNTKLTLNRDTENFVKQQGNDAGVNLVSLGSLAMPNNLTSSFNTKSQVVENYLKVLKSLSDKDVKTSVSGANSYVLGYTDRIFEVPDEDSKYHSTNKTVPFYQMVVHGYIDYSSLSGNKSFSVDYQKLKWIETGSIPQFLITKENPSMLKDTDYTEIFSSEYSMWKDEIIETYKEFNEKLGDVWNETIDRHEYLSDTLVRVTYGNGDMTYINYGDDAVKLDGIEIDGTDFVVIKN